MSVYVVDDKGNVTRQGGGKVPSGVSVQLKGQEAGSYEVNDASGIAAPNKGGAPATGTGTLAQQVTGGTTNFSAAGTDSDSALGLGDFPLDAQGNPAYVAPMWIAGFGPAVSTPGYLAEGGQTNVGALGGSHPGYTAPDTRPHSISDPGRIFYRQSDPWAIASDVGSIPHVQQQLIAAGLLDATKITQGLWGADDAAAMATVMTNANLHGVTWQEMLNYAAKHPNVTRLQVKLDNPGDIRLLAQNAIAPAIGRDLTSDEMSKFMQAYQKWQFGQQSSATTQADQTPQPTAITQPETAAAFASDYAHEQFAGDERNAGLHDAFSKLDTLLKGG